MRGSRRIGDNKVPEAVCLDVTRGRTPGHDLIGETYS